MSDSATPTPDGPVSGDGLTSEIAQGGESLDRPASVLLIDDSPQYAALLDAMLDGLWPPALHLVHHQRLADGIEHLAHHPVGCVLLDLGLPDADGLVALRRLRRLAPEVPVVVLTGRDDEATALRAVQEGAQDYLIKSRSDATLISRTVRSEPFG